MLRDRGGVERIAYRYWTGSKWLTVEIRGSVIGGYGSWRILLSSKPFWPRGPRMVFEEPW